MRKRDVLAGVLLLNAIPHTIMGLAGKRSMTPLGGANSSAATNLTWAALNILTATTALTSSTWRSADQRTAEDRLRAVHVGICGMAAFSACYELTPNSARRRRERIEADQGH